MCKLNSQLQFGRQRGGGRQKGTRAASGVLFQGWDNYQIQLEKGELRLFGRILEAIHLFSILVRRAAFSSGEIAAFQRPVRKRSLQLRMAPRQTEFLSPAGSPIRFRRRVQFH